MKNFTLFAKFALLTLTAVFAVSCVFEKMDDPETQILSIKVDHPLVASQPEFVKADDHDIVFYVKPETTQEDFLTFAPKISVSPGCELIPPTDTPSDFTKGLYVYTVQHVKTGQRKYFRIKVIRNKYLGSEILSVALEYDKIVKAPEVPATGTSIEFVVSAEATQEEMSKLAPTFTWSTGASISPASGSEQDFNAGTVEYTVTSEAGKSTVYTVSCIREMFEDAKLTELVVEDPKGIVTKQPVFEAGKSDYTFYVKALATDEEVAALIPTITLSPGATLSEDSPELGKAPGFKEDKVFKYTIVSEDGEHESEFTIVCTKKKIVYDFEDWVVEFNYTDGNDYYVPGPAERWGTSNRGSLLAGAGIPVYNDRLVVLKIEGAEAYAGNGAAKLRTLDTQPKSSFLQRMIPRVTSGSLFLGSFDLNYGQQLKSTKFGVPFEEKPMRITGQYKYTPGPDFYAVLEGDIKGNPTLIPDKIDKGIIGAILYDITDNEEYITGENTYTDPRIIAIQHFVCEDGVGAGYQKFVMDLNYSAEYSKEKKYRLAIIMSSSIEGADFNGAPGSTLCVDDVAVYYED